MGALQQFFWGFVGGLAVEIPPLLRASHSGKGFPRRLRRLSYWLVRLFVAIVSGLFAVAAQAQSPLLAVHLGITTPLLIAAMRNTLPVPLPSDPHERRQLAAPEKS